MKPVLLIVDVQNDFLPPEGSLAVQDGNEIISIINKLQGCFDLVVATKDWHPPNHSSFAKFHGKKTGETIEFQGRKQELWPVHCVQGTHGAEFSPLLETKQVEQVFYKGIEPNVDSYSAFFDNAHLRSTGLKEYLRERHIDEVYIVGLTTDYCVYYSAQDAINLGFSVSVVTDACKGVELHSGDIEKAIQKMRQMGVKLVTSGDVFLSHSRPRV